MAVVSFSPRGLIAGENRAEIERWMAEERADAAMLQETRVGDDTVHRRDKHTWYDVSARVHASGRAECCGAYAGAHADATDDLKH
eukprot:8580584-Alexandrium_andersonii.AAC.1